jgi:Uma2 family endonuclease
MPTIPISRRMMAHARGDVFGRIGQMHMALSTHRWTRADLQRLPNDGNKYEVVQGELLVSPAPTPAHDALVRELWRRLNAYCEATGIGQVSGHLPAFVAGDSEAIPDLVVREAMVPPPDRWDDAPRPLLVVEVLSESTQRNDRVRKRGFYLASGIPEYWIVDGESRTIEIASIGGDRTEASLLRWHPPQAKHALELDVPALFEDALGPARPYA